ncbi:MAG TPA: M20/M25/M40 family metallo-hydrolase, partial [Thermoanaerobaculia bacterium]|nr:M20/M25/M40 family metallo-hydrolase [Thermoanaerobaculia bacterium]
MGEALTKKKLTAFAERNRDAFEKLLKEFVEIPSVSAEPEHAPDIQRMAKLGAATLRSFGARAEILETRGNPIVVGSFPERPGAPTVTLYNHLDVQPADREPEGWRTEPFTFVREGNRYFGRGTTDDKGPALSALFGVRAALEADVPLNIRVIWELEEEIGSPSFEKGIAEHAQRLATDSVLVSDTIWVSRNQPACPSGLRGMQAFEFVLEIGKTDHHSGTTGGAARNPLGELMKMIVDMYDPVTGRVRIKGFYEDVVPPSKRELKEFVDSGFSVAQFKRAHQLRSLRTEVPLEVMKRIWAMPTFEVHGVTGGYSGPGIKTIIPPRASVKVSCRLVPDQRPERIVKLVRDFVKAKYPDVRIEIENRMMPYRGPTDGALSEAVRNAMKFAFG